MNVLILKPDQSLEIVLDGIVVSEQPQYTVHYAESTTTGLEENNTFGVSNNTTPVSILENTTTASKMVVKEITFYNSDSGSVSLCLSLVDSSSVPSSSTIIWKGAVLSGQTWTLSNFIAGTYSYIPFDFLDSDENLIADSDFKVSTQHAIKTYVDTAVGGTQTLAYLGDIECSGNPNYPSSIQRDTYRVSTAGKIGGSSGVQVEVGDLILCIEDNGGGTQAAVGNKWTIIQGNLVNPVTGPASSTSNNLVMFDGTSGTVIKDSGLTISGNNTGDETTSTIKQKLGEASGSSDGYLSSTSWTTFNNKQPTISVGSNAGLALNTNTLSTTYNTTMGDTVLSTAVGGATAQAASVWKTRTIVQALDTILFPTVSASIKTSKSVSLVVTGLSSVLEVGRSLSRTLTATFNQGAIYNGDGTTNTNALVGVASQYTFTGTGITSTSQASNVLTFTGTIVNGSNTWAVTVTHGAGTGAYYDNKNNPETHLDSYRIAGTVSASYSTPIVTGLYPIFYGKSSTALSAAQVSSIIQQGYAIKSVSGSTGTITLTPDCSNEYFWFAHVASSTSKETWYNTSFNNGRIEDTGFIREEDLYDVTSPDGYWSSISYKIYISNYATTTSGSYEFRN